MIFAKPGEYKACGLFTYQHFSLIICTAIGIFLAVKCTKINDKNDIRKIIIKTTILVWILEIIKIIFNFKIGMVIILIHMYHCIIVVYYYMQVFSVL